MALLPESQFGSRAPAVSGVGGENHEVSFSSLLKLLLPYLDQDALFGTPKPFVMQNEAQGPTPILPIGDPSQFRMLPRPPAPPSASPAATPGINPVAGASRGAALDLSNPVIQQLMDVAKQFRMMEPAEMKTTDVAPLLRAAYAANPLPEKRKVDPWQVLRDYSMGFKHGTEGGNPVGAAFQGAFSKQNTEIDKDYAEALAKRLAKLGEEKEIINAGTMDDTRRNDAKKYSDKFISDALQGEFHALTPAASAKAQELSNLVQMRGDDQRAATAAAQLGLERQKYELGTPAGMVKALTALAPPDITDPAKRQAWAIEHWKGANHPKSEALKPADQLKLFMEDPNTARALANPAVAAYAAKLAANESGTSIPQFMALVAKVNSAK